ncbi:hypothetical protein ACFX13_039890 [Malus domestica]
MRMKTLSTDMPVEMGYCGPPDPESCSSLTCLRSLRRMQLSNPKVVVSTRFELAWQRESGDHVALSMPAVARGGVVHNRRETAETGSTWTVHTKMRVLLLYNKTIHN